MKRHQLYKGAAILFAVMGLGGLMLTTALTSSVLAFWANQNIDANIKALKTYYAAYSGIQDALIKLERNQDFTGNFNLSVNTANDVSVSVSFASGRATIVSTSTLASIGKKIQTIVDIDADTGLITPTSTIEQAL